MSLLSYIWFFTEDIFWIGGYCTSVALITVLAILMAKWRKFPLEKYWRETIALALASSTWPVFLLWNFTSNSQVSSRFLATVGRWVESVGALFQPMGELLQPLLVILIDIPFIGLPVYLAFWAASFSLPLVLVFLIGWFVYKKVTKRNIKPLELARLGMLAVSLAFISALAFAFWVILIWSMEGWCRNNIFKMHEFNAHLKATCIEAEDKSQCPLDESQLRAFNPQAYGRIEVCTKIAYRYRPETNEYWMLIRWGKNAALVFHPRYYPQGYSMLMLEKDERYQSWADQYPPDFEGPWELLP